VAFTKDLKILLNVLILLQLLQVTIGLDTNVEFQETAFNDKLGRLRPDFWHSPPGKESLFLAGLAGGRRPRLEDIQHLL
jgi:hypothetical protein